MSHTSEYIKYAFIHVEEFKMLRYTIKIHRKTYFTLTYNVRTYHYVDKSISPTKIYWFTHHINTV